jgi:hypothetical protein
MDLSRFGLTDVRCDSQDHLGKYRQDQRQINAHPMVSKIVGLAYERLGLYAFGLDATQGDREIHYGAG